MPVCWNVFTGRWLKPLSSSINTDMLWAVGVIGWEWARGVIKGHICLVLQLLLIQALIPLFPSSPRVKVPCASLMLQGGCWQCGIDQTTRREGKNSTLTNARLNHVFGISRVTNCENFPWKLWAITQAGSSGTVAQLHEACELPFCTPGWFFIYFVF